MKDEIRFAAAEAEAGFAPVPGLAAAVGLPAAGLGVERGTAAAKHFEKLHVAGGHLFSDVDLLRLSSESEPLDPVAASQSRAS